MSSNKKKALFDDDDDDSADDSSQSSSNDKVIKKKSATSSLTVNKSFAEDYVSRKQFQELQNNRSVLDDDDDDDDESNSSDEEHDNEHYTKPEFDLQFFKTMNALRNKDQSIYDQRTQFFDTNEGALDDTDKTGHQKDGSKATKFKDILRSQILDQIEEEETGKSGPDTSEKTRFEYDEQQKELREAFLKGTHGDGDNDDSSADDDADLLIVKKKAPPNATKDLETQKRLQLEIENAKKTSNKSGSADFVDPRGEVQDGNAFLLEYLADKKWKDDDSNNSNNNDDASSVASSIHDLDKADEFEAKYNFRFEEAAAETGTSGAAFSMQTYARGTEMNTLRRNDDTRKQKRQARKERKAAERKAKEEQLKRLKNAKKAEMNKKLSQVKAVLGSVENEAAVDEAAIMKLLEGDFDPDKFEEAMHSAYNDDFYNKEDAEWKDDKDVRETMLQDENALETGVNKDIYDDDNDDEGNYDEDDAAQLEGDYDDVEGMEVDEYAEGDDADIDTGAGKSLEQKLQSKVQDELYKLDYEDIVAGMPTRFKYKQVEPNRFGLSPEDILLARDSTLKQYVSIKKMAPYREDGEYRISGKKRKKLREQLEREAQEIYDTKPAADKTENLDEEVDKQKTDEAVTGTKKKRRRLKKGKKKDKNDEKDQAETNEEPKPDEAINTDKDADKAVVESTKLSKPDESETKIISPEKDKAVAKKSEKSKPKKSRKKKKRSGLSTVPASRLDSYGL